MAIWIGEAGGIRIGRTASERLYAYIQPSDVDVSGKRFGFDQTSNALITGDRIWLRRVDESGSPTAGLLDFVDASGWPDATQHNDGQWYVNTDVMGNIRLFATWQAALRNDSSDAITLATPGATYRVSYEVISDDAAPLAQTVGWTLNTDREMADFTSLGDTFQQQMGTTVSGGGELDCLFDSGYRYNDPAYSLDNEESSAYLHRLILRQEVGSTFKGVFLLKRTNTVPVNVLIGAAERNKELFYVADCVITSVASELSPDEPIHSRITFVTTGAIQLLYDYVSGYLLQEQVPNDKILQETGFGILLEVPS